jgi:deazaflavin-dependent oxidoreductase (nitroreductase family)
MNHKPNALQRFFHRLIAFKVVSALLSRILQPADEIVLFITRGKHTFAELLLPTIEVETIGARTGQRRTHPLGGFIDVDRYILVGTNFGSQHHPAWVYNLWAHPECVVHSSERSGNYMAREANGEEREKYWQLALSYYKTYAVYEKRAAPRKISVWILEPIAASSSRKNIGTS